MNRPLGHSLLVLPVLAALIAAPAMAQTQGQAQSRSNPMDGLMGLFRQEAQNQPNNVQQDNGSDIESEGLPPPGFGTRNGAPPPVGHQFGDQRPPQAATAHLPQAEAIRPPRYEG